MMVTFPVFNTACSVPVNMDEDWDPDIRLRIIVNSNLDCSRVGDRLPVAVSQTIVIVKTIFCSMFKIIMILDVQIVSFTSSLGREKN